MDHKNFYKYHLSLRMTKGKEEQQLPEPVELDFENHDDIFRIMELLKAKKLFADEQQVEAFAIGLKLFSGVMMQHRDSELFRELMPGFKAFMKNLKGK